MVLMLDDSSKIGAYVRSTFFYLICIRLLIRSRAVTNRIFFSKRPISLHIYLGQSVRRWRAFGGKVRGSRWEGER